VRKFEVFNTIFPMLNFIELSTTHSQPPAYSIIWLHGLGADGNDFAPIAQELELPLPVRFIFPHAPAMPVSINHGYVMPAWYDIYALDIAARQDKAGILHSQAEIEALMAQEIERGIKPEHIMLAGFSQGGAIALHTALRYPHRLAGVMGLSTYLPLSSDLFDEHSEANRQLPIFMAHGRHDSVIPLNTASASKNFLEQAGYPVEWHEYPMEHSVCIDELADIRAYIMRSFGV